jgi:putative endonuclease
VTRQTQGAQAEALAASFLQARGLKLITRNYRCRAGEVDLIMQDGQVTVFVEVRLRSNRAWVSAAESIDARKQRRIIIAARHYLARHGESQCRFDCVLLAALDAQQIEWLRDAFSAH